MKRQRLKNHLGCDRCKVRRKKCDEQRPLCGSCVRLGLICSWHNTCDRQEGGTGTKTEVSLTETAANIRRVPMSRKSLLAQRRYTSTGYAPFRDQTQFHFTVEVGRIFGLLISQAALPAFHDTSVLVTLAIQNKWLRDVMAGFAASFLHSADHQDTLLKTEAAKLYQRALVSVQEVIKNPSYSVNSIEMLVAITFLGLTESLGIGNAEAARIHFLATAKICRDHRPSYRVGSLQFHFYCIVVECWLYNFATSAIFYRDCDEVMQSIDWSVLGSTFGNSAILDASAYRASPHFGGNHTVYQMMLQMTWYLRKPFSPTDTVSRVIFWRNQLNRLESGLGMYFSRLPPKVAELYYWKYKLHIYALRILLAKIRCRETRSSDPSILAHVRTAQQVFELKDVRERSNPALAWPLIIFMIAAHDTKTLEFFASTITTIHHNFDEGHTRRLDAVINMLRWRARRGQDGLDLLVQENGIIGTTPELGWTTHSAAPAEWDVTFATTPSSSRTSSDDTEVTTPKLAEMIHIVSW